MKSMSLTLCKELLSVNGRSSGDVNFDGRHLGRFVTHGHRSGNGQTVYASRITAPFRIEVEGTTRNSMMSKIAAELHKGVKEHGLAPSDIGKA